LGFAPFDVDFKPRHQMKNNTTERVFNNIYLMIPKTPMAWAGCKETMRRKQRNYRIKA
jgi:hypothetical protein